MVMKKMIITIAIGAFLLGFESCISCGEEQESESDEVTIDEVDTSSSQPKSDEVKTSKPEKPAFKIVPVDLGLSVLWANANVGASSVYDVGGYYAWGEHESKSIYEMDNYFDYSVRVETGGYIHKSFNVFSKSDMSLLGTEYDTAQNLLGGNWRMPTREEYMELIEKCKITKEIKQMAPEKFLTFLKIQGPNGKVIILPFGGEKTGHSHYKWDGYYWTTDLFKKESNASKAFAAHLGDFIHDTYIILRDFERSKGMNVRAVMDKKITTSSENSDAESFVKQFYDYYLKNWSNVSSIHKDVADNYLTEDYAEEYEYYMRRRAPYLDLIIETTHSDGDECPYYLQSCDYIGDNKVKVSLKYYDNRYGFQTRYVFLSKEGSNYRIKKIKWDEE